MVPLCPPKYGGATTGETYEGAVCVEGHSAFSRKSPASSHSSPIISLPFLLFTSRPLLPADIDLTVHCRRHLPSSP